MYLLSNLQHGSGRVGGPLEGPRGMCEYPTNGVPAAGAARALLVAMDAWADHGTAPPPNRVPDVRTRTLVPLSEARAAFPSIPGIRFSPSIQERYTDHSGYVRAVEEATRTLVKERFLLPEDAERYVRDAQASDVLR